MVVGPIDTSVMLPLALLGPIAGVFVDRWPLKPTLVWSDLIRAGLVIVLLFTTALWQIYLVLVALSCVSSFFAPAQSVTIRTHVPPHGLISANALMIIAASVNVPGVLRSMPPVMMTNIWPSAVSASSAANGAIADNATRLSVSGTQIDATMTSTIKAM